MCRQGRSPLTVERLAALTAGAILLVGLASSVAVQSSQPTLLLAADVAYGPDKLERADIYGERDLRGAPVVIFFHGGAYAFGDKNQSGGLWGNVGRTLARAGFLAVNADYRLSPQATWPAGAQDVGRQVAWARKNAGRFGGDADRIVLVGHSAGATHVAGYVLDRRLQPRDGPGVAGAVLVSGRYTLDIAPGDINRRQVIRYFGEDAAVRADRAPIAHLATAPRIPLLVVVAGRENASLADAASALVSALQSRGDRPAFLRLSREGHLSEMANLGTSDHTLSEPLIDFVRRPTTR